MSGETLDKPVVNEGSYAEWAVKDGDGFLFTSRERHEAEEWMRRLADMRPNALLVRRQVRYRAETWFGADVVLPWHTPCEWVGEAGENGTPIPGTVHCFAHDHDETEPVPAAHIRASASSSVPPDTDTP